MSTPSPEYDSAAERRTDELEIRWAIETWVVWRDAGAWHRFATLWRPEGRMFATWFPSLRYRIHRSRQNLQPRRA